MTPVGRRDIYRLGAALFARPPAALFNRRSQVFSAQTQSLERVPVKKAGGKEAKAMGLKITLKDGKLIHVVVNYELEGTEVVLGALRTKQRFATDYRE
ncbi:MAG: hypothetical protein FJ290_22720 [Planctomycetes bacterium]|nr:hypothetical protein [Planctomycetota bacterium]